MHAPANTAAIRSMRLLLHLLDQGRITTAQAARVLGVPARQAREDLKRVAAAAPIRTRGEGRDRTWEIEPSAALGRLGVLDRVSLRLGREVTSFLAGTALHEGLERAEGDGLAEVPARWNHNLDRKFRHLQEPARSYTAHRDTLDAVLDALLRERSLCFGYVRPDRTVEYADFRLFTLVVYRRAVYLLGRVGEAGPDLRLALDRVREARVGAPFAFPDAWDPDAELARFFGIVASGEPERVVLRFAARVGRLVHARAWHPTARIEDLPDGRVELSMVTAGAELVRFALEWGATCEVVEPAWLRDTVAAELRAALAAYGAPPPEP